MSENINYEQFATKVGEDFVDILKEYSTAESPEALEKEKDKISNRLRELQLLFEKKSFQLFLLFFAHLKERLLKVNEDSKFWSLEIDKRNWIGIKLGELGSFYLSEIIYRDLYDLLCEIQEQRGRRISKGLPLQNIGWIELMRGNAYSLNRSKHHMKLAMIEDILSNEEDFIKWPAYNSLRSSHKLSENYLLRLAKSVKKLKSRMSAETWFRPEIIYLEFAIDRNNQERSSHFDFDKRLAAELLEKVKRSTDANDKGESLEILMSYLFLLSPGFEVLRNIRSFDSQIDLLISFHPENL